MSIARDKYDTLCKQIEYFGSEKSRLYELISPLEQEIRKHIPSIILEEKLLSSFDWQLQIKKNEENSDEDDDVYIISLFCTYDKDNDQIKNLRLLLEDKYYCSVELENNIILNIVGASIKLTFKDQSKIKDFIKNHNINISCVSNAIDELLFQINILKGLM